VTTDGKVIAALKLPLARNGQLQFMTRALPTLKFGASIVYTHR
jgi:hypothetical protein